MKLPAEFSLWTDADGNLWAVRGHALLRTTLEYVVLFARPGDPGQLALPLSAWHKEFTLHSEGWSDG